MSAAGRVISRSLAGRFEVCILAGGLSSRMGRDKARLRLGRWSLLGHVRRAAAALGQPVRILRKDVVARCGPLGGICTALRRTRQEAVLFLSCDMPFVSPDLLRKVAEEMKPGVRAAFCHSEGRAGFPLLLRKDALPVVEKLIEQQRFSLQELARVLSAVLLPVLPADEHQLFNVNTPIEMEQARAWWKSRLSA